MINTIAFVIAACIYLFIWAMGVHGLTAALIPALVLILAAAAYTYIPLIKKTIHRER
ncbi:MAG: hypothetical protein QM648_04530 [Solirubrobacterales bacterium]